MCRKGSLSDADTAGQRGFTPLACTRRLRDAKSQPICLTRPSQNIWSAINQSPPPVGSAWRYGSQGDQAMEEFSAKRRATDVLARVRHESSSAELDIQVVDVSSDGAAFVVAEPLSLGAPIVLVLAGGSMTQVGGLVKWVEPQGSKWRVGCRFDQELDASFIRSSGGPSRSNCQIPATFQRQGSACSHDAVIHNHSDGGVCLTTNTPLDPGQPILIAASRGSRAETFVVRVVWSRSEDEVFHVGCQFSPSTEKNIFRRLLRTSPIEVASVPGGVPTRRSERGLWMASCFIYGWSALYAFGGWPFG